MDNEFNDVKSRAALDRSMIEQNLRKRMSDMGVGAPNLTASNNMQMAGLNEQGAIQGQQNLYNSQQTAIGKTNALNTEANAIQYSSAIDTNRTGSEIDTANTMFSTYYQLYVNRKINANQFYKLTGVDVKTLGGSGTTYNNPDDMFTDPVMPDYISSYVGSQTPVEKARKSGVSLGR